MKEIEIVNRPNIFIVVLNCIRRTILWEIYKHSDKELINRREL